MVDYQRQNDANPSAWQPLTFAGVAGLATASLWRFRLIRFLMAVFSTICVTWFVNVALLETVRDAIEHLSSTGYIRDGRMEWSGPPVAILAQGTVVTIVVDTALAGDAGQVTDWQIILGRQEARLCSIFGYTPVPYPAKWSLPIRLEALQPWWGAWEPAILAAVAGGAMLFFLIAWATIGLGYGLLLRIYCYFLDRKANFGTCWRAGQASLFSGALLLDAALLLYGHGRLDLIGLVFAFGLHAVIPWLYLLGAPLHFPPLNSMGANPFAARK